MKYIFSYIIILLFICTSQAQNIGIGNPMPTAKLDVLGTLKVNDGTQGSGKILTSDATGLASWQPPPAAPPVNSPSVSICCNSWMIKNLDVSTYRNGDPIPKVTSNTAWAALTTGAYCYYNNDSTTYAATYGKIYNWYAVNDSRGLAPQGWHIATDFEWLTLSNCLGGYDISGGSLKETGTTHWTTPNTGATNYSNFTAVPGGYRINNTGVFSGIGTQAYWWSASTTASILSWYESLNYNEATFHGDVIQKSYGCYVRCIKD